jgi:3-oxoacyl-ACP reductase-like protein
VAWRPPRQRLILEPEDCVEFDRKYYRARRDLMRLWCGPEAINRFDELTELRKEIRRVGKVAEGAINALRAAGHQMHAASLEDAHAREIPISAAT